MPGTDKSTILNKIQEIADRSAAREGLEVVELELLGGGNSRLLRIYIDKPGGVTHGDCELMSQQIGTVLDVEDVIPGGSYTLEVSSPGVERKLSRPSDFERFAGQKAKVVLKEPVENQKHWEGVLRGIQDGVIAIEPQDGRVVHVPLDQVRRANLKFDW
ncbi:MAG: ribosome maturation factor RimP [Bryobacteraceae bacterium]|nr:ribosome maturation factor RimP [Bryobacteraceae bacterium]